MAFKIHRVTKYNYSFDARTGSPNILQLWGSNGKIADVRFVADNAAIPSLKISADLNKAGVYFKRSVQMALIDMLRNESPVSVTINDQGSGFVYIGTGQEPVGEGE